MSKQPLYPHIPGKKKETPKERVDPETGMTQSEKIQWLRDLGVPTAKNKRPNRSRSDECPICSGTGRLRGRICPNCAGHGTIA